MTIFKVALGLALGVLLIGIVGFVVIESSHDPRGDYAEFTATHVKDSTGFYHRKSDIPRKPVVRDTYSDLDNPPGSGIARK